MSRMMETAGFCCGSRFYFEPPALVCEGKPNCKVLKNAKYFGYQDKYVFCQKCFNSIHGNCVTVTADDSEDVNASSTQIATSESTVEPKEKKITLQKSEFVVLYNDHREKEKFVKCKCCGKEFHQICVLYFRPLWPKGYVCNACYTRTRTSVVPLSPHPPVMYRNRPTAKALPQTSLSKAIEERVNNCLAMKESGVEVTVRVVSCAEKYAVVKPGMKKKFTDNGQFREKFPYKVKSIFLFQEIDNVDVCLFGMHVQEYGSDCPAPNSRRVYIAYLDSIHFFRPRHLRTTVYHEVLLSYLEYAKKRGFVMAHIWACPPNEGDDYIFHNHPPDQKVPKPKRLQEWYKKMLERGKEEGIVVDYKDILQQAIADQVSCPTQLPYFEDDFWPTVIEESIKTVEREEKEEQEERERAALEQQRNVSVGTTPVLPPFPALLDNRFKFEVKAEPVEYHYDEYQCPDQDIVMAEAAVFATSALQLPTIKVEKRKQRRKTQYTRKKKKEKKRSKVPHNGDELMDKIYQSMQEHKDLFFVIRLHPQESVNWLDPTNDQDPVHPCELMDGRDAFLSLAREGNHEFSTLRRAKYSTLIMLYELHSQGKFLVSCNNCQCQLTTVYLHCCVCEDFDLCVSCHQGTGHLHQMQKMIPPPQLLNTPSQEEERGADALDSFNKCMRSVTHCIECNGSERCRLTSCTRMREIFAYMKTCPGQRLTPDSSTVVHTECAVCRQVLNLYLFHVGICKDPSCTLPFCAPVKRFYEIRRQQKEMQRRMARQMQTRIPEYHALGSRTLVLPNGSPTEHAVNPVVTNSVSSSLADSDIKPTQIRSVPVAALQAARKVQEEAARQAQAQAQITSRHIKVEIGETNAWPAHSESSNSFTHLRLSNGMLTSSSPSTRTAIQGPGFIPLQGPSSSTSAVQPIQSPIRQQALVAGTIRLFNSHQVRPPLRQQQYVSNQQPLTPMLLSNSSLFEGFNVRMRTGTQAPRLPNPYYQTSQALRLRDPTVSQPGPATPNVVVQSRHRPAQLVLQNLIGALQKSPTYETKKFVSELIHSSGDLANEYRIHCEMKRQSSVRWMRQIQLQNQSQPQVSLPAKQDPQTSSAVALTNSSQQQPPQK